MAEVLGAPVPRATWVFFLVAAVALRMAKAIRFGGRATVGGARISQAAIDSDGWRKDSFLMRGLEEDGAARQEYTDEAGMYGYRRGRGDQKHSWRFIREPGS